MDINASHQNQNNEPKYSFKDMFLGLLTVSGFIMYIAFAWGFILYEYYYWFLLPVFTTLPLITYYQAVGLACFINLFKNQHYLQFKQEFRDDSLIGGMLFLTPFLVITFGYIVHYFLLR